MNMKLVFADMYRKLEQISKLIRDNEGKLTIDIENELDQLANQSAEIAEEWLKFEEKLGQVLRQERVEPVQLADEDWLKAKAFYDLTMFADAIPHFNQVIKKYPEFEQARLYLAHAYIEEGAYEQATYTLQFLVKTTSDKEMLNVAYHTLGCMEGNLQHYSKALYYFQKINMNDIKKEWQATVIFNYALALFYEGKYETCLEQLVTYYHLSRGDWKGPYMLGKVYVALGDEEAGISFWFEALQLREHKTLLKEMARHFEKRKLYQMAALCYQRTLADRGNLMDKEAWFGLAWNSGLLEKVEASEESYLKAMCLFPNELNLIISYTWMLILWNKRKKAERLINILMEHHSDHPLIKGLPLLYRGKYGEALQILTTV